MTKANFKLSCCVTNSFLGILGDLRGQLYIKVATDKLFSCVLRTMRLISFVYIATRDHKKIFSQVTENDQVCSKCYFDELCNKQC